MTTPLYVRLAHARNSDLPGGYWEASPPNAPVSAWHPVATVQDAARRCRQYITQHSLGGGNWVGGEIAATPDGPVMAQVSYNGRIWDPAGQEVLP